jgi:2-C-methyl-D-erythritol 4-phosphate cytidylyltransferase
MRTVAVVLAGGTGQRFGTSTPKQLLLLGGRPMIEHSLLAFDQAPGVDAVLAVVPAGFAREVADLLDRGVYRKLIRVIEGGVTRAGSTQRALAALGETECNVLFHDAARPLVGQRIIADCVTALDTAQACAVAIPASDTIAEVDDNVVAAMPARNRLVRFQTPQGFRLSVISRAYRAAGNDPGFAAATPTDDCGVVFRYLPEVPIRIVPGSDHNIKITYPADLAFAEVMLARRGGSPDLPMGGRPAPAPGAADW